MDKKLCAQCGAETYEEELTCPLCGSNEFVPVQDPQPASAAEAAARASENENILAGIVGALLFSLGGVLVYFLLYQLNVIAAISAVVMYLLADLGYGIFSGNRKGRSLLRIIICFVVVAVMLFAAEYICVAFELTKAFKELGEPISFFEAIRIMPEAIKEPDIKSAMAGDLAFAYIFAVISGVFKLVEFFKNKKKA